MFIPFRLVSLELQRSGSWKVVRQYRKSLEKHQKNFLRIDFLEKCKHSDLIPRFLKFRIPTNGCFDDKAVRDFQLKLLRKEIIKAKADLSAISKRLTENRKQMSTALSRQLLPSIWLWSQVIISKQRRSQLLSHNKKLAALSEAQERPLFSVRNTVMECNLDIPLPHYVSSTLSLGPKNAVLDSFNEKDVLAEVDGLLYHCKVNKVAMETINDINVKTLNYVKLCKKQKQSRNLTMTKRFLKENNLIAVPFDKGIGICVMKKEDYNKKLDTILQLPQFEKLKLRKNAKHPVMKEEQRIVNILKKMRDEKRIDDSLYDKIKPMGSQPPRLSGLAKVHKASIPVRPVLSMPGSAYHRIAIQVADWLSTVPECQINSSTQKISQQLSSHTLSEEEELVSFDVSSLYTNVPVTEAINVCADLLFRESSKKPPVDKITFIELAKIASCNVVMSTHDGYYQQVDGLAMGSPPAPPLANGWLNQYDSVIRGNARLFTRYMDDILMEINRLQIEAKLAEINNLHPNLAFTIEREVDGSLPFLDMQLIHDDKSITSTWYSKPTDTGLILNYHSLAPRRYKKSVVSGFVHRIFRACSTWSHFHNSMQRAKVMLESNQYPPTFYEPIINQTLNGLLAAAVQPENRAGISDGSTNVSPPNLLSQSSLQQQTPKRAIFIQYR